MDINNIIFDMDGVILDSIPLHKKSYEKIFKDMDIDFSLDNFDEINGRNIEDAFDYIYKNNDDNFDREVASEAKKEANIKIAENSPLVNGIKELIRKLKIDGYTLTLATSATREEADIVLDRFSLREDFSCIVTGDDVEKSKPNPEIFKTCMDKLKLDPKKTLVVEDAPRGVEAAKKAGAKVIAVTTTHDRNQLNNADHIVDNPSDTYYIVSGGIKFEPEKLEVIKDSRLAENEV